MSPPPLGSSDPQSVSREVKAFHLSGKSNVLTKPGGQVGKNVLLTTRPLPLVHYYAYCLRHWFDVVSISYEEVKTVKATTTVLMSKV